MRRTIVPFFIIFIIFTQTLYGVVPQKWEVRSKDDFLKGKLDGISISYDGILSLSPREVKIDSPAEEFYLSLLITDEGTMFLGTGHGGNIYRLSKDGRADLYFQVPEMDVYCLVQDKKGNLYAGTSPNGKIYQISGKNKGKIFFDPREKYIWDLLFGEKGFLLAAVGENGGLYEINTEGEGRLILSAEENHVLCIEKNANGDLIAGTGGKGLLYRIPREGKPNILFESPFEEIKNIALDREGNVYAASGGKVISPKKEELPVSVKTEVTYTVTVSPTSVEMEPSALSGKEQPGVLFKVNPQGVAQKLWESSDELVYDLLWDERENRVIFSTGDKGRIFAVDNNEKVSLLIQKESEQAYSLLPYNSKIYVLANNPSELSVLYPEQIMSGEYLSQVIDTKTISSWGRIEWEAEVPPGCNLQLQTRSGNSSRPHDTWSDWSPPYQKMEGEQILSPKARYIQFKARFMTPSGKLSPHLDKINLFYLQTNLVPEITQLRLLPPNEVYLMPPIQEEVVWGMDVGLSDQMKDKKEEKAVIVPKKVERKGFQTITWEAKDENGDDLFYFVLIKKEDEAKWRILKEKWKDSIYAFDTLSFPDGIYFVKVQAFDAPSNPPGMELKAEKVSRPLIIDNSLPLIKNFKAIRDKDRLLVSFQTEDSMSYIKEVEYLIRPDDWKIVFPEDRICDSKQESFKITANLPSGYDNLIIIRIKDSSGNIGVHRETF